MGKSLRFFDEIWLIVWDHEWNSYLVRLHMDDTVLWIDEEVVDWRGS